MRSTTLPNSWCEATFEDVLADISNGISDSQNKEAEGIPVSRIETIATGKVNLAKIGYVSNISESAAERYLLDPGDILFSHINSPAHIGKTAIFRSGRLYHGTNVLRIRTQRDACTPEYFEYYCRYFRSIGEFSMNAQHAVNQSSLNQKKIKAFTLPLPPLAEQARIAHKLDELLAQVDTLKARIDAIPGLLKRFRQSVLTAAVSGRLTEEWRGERELPNFSEVEFGCLIKEGPQNGLYKPSSAYGVGVKIIRIDSFYSGEITDWNRLRSLAVDQSELESWGVNTGDILINRVNSIEYLGKCALVRSVPEPTVFESNVMRMSLRTDLVNPEYLMRFLSSEIGRKKLITKAKHAVNQASINQGDVKACKVPLPSLTEQNEIVCCVEQLFAFAAVLEDKVVSAKNRIDHMTQSILAKAFRGELVPQDPNDEPASMLLERIQAQRASTPKARRGRKSA